MFPAGIISSGGCGPAVMVLVPSPGCWVTICAVGEPGTAWAAPVGNAGAGRFVNAVDVGLLVLSSNRTRTGGRFFPAGVLAAGGVCAPTSRAVKNRIRASVVVFILPLRLRGSICRRPDFSDNWPRAGFWR